jgi:deoxyribonuclease-4
MLHIGCHLSASKGYLAMGKDALKIGADTFQFFTRNPRGGKAKDIDEADVAAFLKLAGDNHFTHILAHAPYTMNACSKDAGIRGFSREMMADDLRRLEYLPGNFYNFHP